MTGDSVASDPETEEEYQLLTGAAGDSVEPIDLIHSYLPDQDDWEAKTFLDEGDAARLAALRSMGSLIPEASDRQEVVDSFLDHYLKSITSEGGVSRQEYLQLLNSLAGGGSTSDMSGDQGLLDRVLNPSTEDNSGDSNG